MTVCNNASYRPIFLSCWLLICLFTRQLTSWKRTIFLWNLLLLLCCIVEKMWNSIDANCLIGWSVKLQMKRRPNYSLHWKQNGRSLRIPKKVVWHLQYVFFILVQYVQCVHNTVLTVWLCLNLAIFDLKLFLGSPLEHTHTHTHTYFILVQTRMPSRKIFYVIISTEIHIWICAYF